MVPHSLKCSLDEPKQWSTVWWQCSVAGLLVFCVSVRAQSLLQILGMGLYSHVTTQHVQLIRIDGHLHHHIQNMTCLEQKNEKLDSPSNSVSDRNLILSFEEKCASMHSNAESCCHNICDASFSWNREFYIECGLVVAHVSTVSVSSSPLGGWMMKPVITGNWLWCTGVQTLQYM